MLATILQTLRSILDLSGSVVRSLFIAICVVALVGDLWAIRNRALYPVAVRRQARKALAFRWKRGWAVGAVWGFDAGFGVGTYRVTSGLWLGSLGVVMGQINSWTILVYSAAFAGGIIGFTVWPARGNGEARAQAAHQRLGLLARIRWVPQTAYTALVVGGLLGLAL